MEIDRRDALKTMGLAAAFPLVPWSMQEQEQQKHDLGLTRTQSSPEDYKKAVIAVLLDNQRRHNPKLIPQMRNLFTYTNLWDFVSIQPAVSDSAFAYNDSALAFKMEYQIKGKKVNLKHKKINPNDEVRLVINSCRVAISQMISPTFGGTPLNMAHIECAVLNAVKSHAGFQATWDFNRSIGDTIKEKYEDLYIENVRVSNKIHAASLRGGGNRIVASPEICSVFETSVSHGFEPDNFENYKIRTEIIGKDIGIHKVGVINNRWNVYKDFGNTMNNSDYLIFYHNNRIYCDSGCVFMPQYLVDENTLKCGLVIVEPNFYAKVTAKNFF